jgi:hypothetical protein
MDRRLRHAPTNLGGPVARCPGRGRPAASTGARGDCERNPSRPRVVSDLEFSPALKVVGSLKVVTGLPGRAGVSHSEQRARAVGLAHVLSPLEVLRSIPNHREMRHHHQQGVNGQVDGRKLSTETTAQCLCPRLSRAEADGSQLSVPTTAEFMCVDGVDGVQAVGAASSVSIAVILYLRSESGAAHQQHRQKTPSENVKRKAEARSPHRDTGISNEDVMKKIENSVPRESSHNQPKVPLEARHRQCEKSPCY